MDQTSTLRLEYFITTRRDLLVAVSVIVLVLSAGVLLTGFLTTPITASEGGAGASESTHIASVEQSVTVNVTEDTSAFEAGESLTDRSFYPRQNTTNPVISATSDAQQATITEFAIVLTYESRPDIGEEPPFYTEQQTLANVTPMDNQAEIQHELDIQAVFQRVVDLQAEFGPQTTTTATVETLARYTYETADGMTQAGMVTAGGPISSTEQMYAVPSGTNRDRQTVGEAGAGGSSSFGATNLFALLFALASIGTLGGVYAVYNRTDLESLQRRIQKQRYAEWVTEVKSYTPDGNEKVVEVSTLEDLVNLAIDTRRRVLYHDRLNEYLVVDDNTMFKYVPEGSERSGVTEFFGMDPEKVDLSGGPNWSTDVEFATED